MRLNLASFSYFDDRPVSTSTRRPWGVLIKSAPRASGMRLASSGCSWRHQRFLGTVPYMAPPSSLNAPSATRSTSKRPIFILGGLARAALLVLLARAAGAGIVAADVGPGLHEGLHLGAAVRE